jgi:2-keto-4-pentenoate hydratase/2-oxohepta-3-ene-1,7-dioic acid hydratase in catechol pathway
MIEHHVIGKIADVRLFLAPLARRDIRTVRCLGLNYVRHAQEFNLPLPKYLVLFFKPVTAVTGPNDDISVAPIAQESEGLDYECELVVVIGKEAHRVPESKALEYVLAMRWGMTSPIATGS